MNWGKGLALALGAFAVMMAWFVIQAAKNPESLVTEDYYGAELKFQERIDEAARAKVLSTPVRMDVQHGSATLQFPAELAGRRITGKLTLLRPNDPQADHVLQLATDDASFTANGLNLPPGRYNALLEWEAEGVNYYTEEKIYVP